jgi:hypothetical protein
MNSIGWRAEKPHTHKQQVTKVKITAPKLRAEANTDVSQYYRSAIAMEDFLFCATIIERRRSLPDRPVLVVAVGPDLANLRNSFISASALGRRSGACDTHRRSMAATSGSAFSSFWSALVISWRT